MPRSQNSLGRSLAPLPRAGPRSHSETAGRPVRHLQAGAAPQAASRVKLVEIVYIHRQERRTGRGRGQANLHNLEHGTYFIALPGHGPRRTGGWGRPMPTRPQRPGQCRPRPQRRAWRPGPGARWAPRWCGRPPPTPACSSASAAPHPRCAFAARRSLASAVAGGEHAVVSELGVTATGCVLGLGAERARGNGERLRVGVGS